MKTLFLSAVVVFLGLNANAQQTPNYNLSSAFVLAKCTPATDENGNATTTCQNDPSSIVNQNQTIPMTCNSSQCTGSWTGNLTVEGTAYTGTITVVQNTDVNGVVTTEVMGQISNDSSVLSVNPSNNVVTDIAAMLGQSIASTTDANTSYILAIVVAPANVQSAIMKANITHKLSVLKK